MNLNYFKDTDELLDDFRSLGFIKKQYEASRLFHKYCDCSKEDFRIIGANTSKTNAMFELYNMFRSIIVDEAKQMVIKHSLPQDITIDTPIYDTTTPIKSAKKPL